LIIEVKAEDHCERRVGLSAFSSSAQVVYNVLISSRKLAAASSVSAASLLQVQTIENGRLEREKGKEKISVRKRKSVVIQWQVRQLADCITTLHAHLRMRQFRSVIAEYTGCHIVADR
jgi:hypothetical protein